jgi:phosphatidylserine synthase
MPNLYFVQGLPITAPVSTLLLFWALCVKIIRDPDEDFAAFRLLSILLVVASVLYIVPQVYGLEAADQANLGGIPSLLTSSSNLAVARPIFWVSLALFGISAGLMFVRSVLQIRDAEPGEVPGGAA